MAETRKKNIFKRIRDKWNELDQETRDWLKVVGIWTVDGYLFGRIVSEYKTQKRLNNIRDAALGVGYMTGKVDAYKEMAMSPYKQMDNGMKRLEQMGKATKF